MAKANPSQAPGVGPYNPMFTGQPGSLLPANHQGFAVDPTMGASLGALLGMGVPKGDKPPTLNAPVGKPGSAAPAPPQSLQDQIAGLGLPASLMPQAQTQGFTQYLDAVNKVSGSKLDKSVKDQLLNTLAQNYQAEQQRQAQEPAQLAYQAFYNQTVLPYLQQQTQNTKGELAPLFQAMSANLSNIPAPYRAMFAQGNNAMQAGADQYLTGLGQQALDQPAINAETGVLQQLLAQSQATQKTIAQQGAISGAQALQSAVPGAAISFTQ